MQIHQELVSASFYCGHCGKEAATVHYLPPFAKDPRFDPEPEGVPPGVGTIGQHLPRTSIAGGPNPVTISVAADQVEAAVAALRAQDAWQVWAIDREFAPFWCFRCKKSYCEDHWRTRTRFDDGFFDCIESFCPAGHRQTLMD